MKIDVDLNEGDAHYIYQFADERIGLIVYVPKALLGEIRKAITGLTVGGEVVLGEIGCGERVWVTKHESGFAVAVGDTDSKDVWISLTAHDVGELVTVGPA